MMEQLGATGKINTKYVVVTYKEGADDILVNIKFLRFEDLEVLSPIHHLWASLMHSPFLINIDTFRHASIDSSSALDQVRAAAIRSSGRHTAARRRGFEYRRPPPAAPTAPTTTTTTTTTTTPPTTPEFYSQEGGVRIHILPPWRIDHDDPDNRPAAAGMLGRVRRHRPGMPDSLPAHRHEFVRADLVAGDTVLPRERPRVGREPRRQEGGHERGVGEGEYQLAGIPVLAHQGHEGRSEHHEHVRVAALSREHRLGPGRRGHSAFVE